MSPLADIVWSFASVLSRVGLASALLGVVLVVYGFIDYSQKNDQNLDEPMPREAWLGRWAKVGFILFFSGIALSTLVLALRVMYPWGE
jgi:hypothetical protein